VSDAGSQIEPSSLWFCLVRSRQPGGMRSCIPNFLNTTRSSSRCLVNMIFRDTLCISATCERRSDGRCPSVAMSRSAPNSPIGRRPCSCWCNIPSVNCCPVGAAPLGCPRLFGRRRRHATDAGSSARLSPIAGCGRGKHTPGNRRRCATGAEGAQRRVSCTDCSPTGDAGPR
jgi:hypothetical protein